MVKQKDFDALKEKVDLLEISFNDMDGCVDGLGVKYKKLSERLSSLEIEAKANKENATVEILGNENLQQGENTITILLEIVCRQR